MDQQELWLDDEEICTPIEHKVCTCCGEDKPLTEYNNNHASKDGKQSRCRVCHRASSAIANAACRTRLDAYMVTRGTACELCHGDFPVQILHLHHVDPATKQHKMTVNFWTAGKKGQSVAREADSCASLCPNCHMTEHYLLDRGHTSFPSAYSTPDGTKPPLNMEKS